MTRTNHPISRRNTLGDISVLHVDALLRAVTHLGHTPSPLMDQFGLDDRLLASPDARISIPRYMRLGQAAIALTGKPALGLTIGTLSRPVDAGIAGLAAQAAATAGQGLETLIRYAPLTSRNSRGQATMATGSARANFYSIRPYNAFNFFVVDSVLASWTRFLRTVTGREQVLAQVNIEYPSLGLDAEFEAWFGCPVAFGAKDNSLQLAVDIPAAPSSQSQPAMYRSLVEQCEQALKRIQSGWSMGERVKEKLLAQLEGEPPRLESMATEFGMTPWTLQRQLSAEGKGYRQLIDETRQDVARDYLRETTLSLSEIAWLLGFSTPAAFHKAYRRWFSVSPGEHRRQASGDPGTL